MKYIFICLFFICTVSVLAAHDSIDRDDEHDPCLGHDHGKPGKHKIRIEKIIY
jgi:hypothetical protein